MQTLYDKWLEILVEMESAGAPAFDIDCMRVGFYAGANAIRTLEANAVHAANTGMISDDEADDMMDFWSAEIEASDLDTDLELH